VTPVVLNESRCLRCGVFFRPFVIDGGDSRLCARCWAVKIVGPAVPGLRALRRVAEELA
jgi:hypothetical protein